MNWKLASIAAIGLAVVGAGVAVAGTRGRARDGIEAQERRYYASLLRADQRPQAKNLFIDFLAETAPDRDLALARLLTWRADASALLSVEQRKKAAELAWFVRHMDAAARLEGLDKLLDGTDREALARRVERLEGASAEDRVAIGFEIFDQAYDLFEPELSKRLTLSDEQRTKLRALFSKAKDDLRPIALRLEKSKVELRRKALALLDSEQSAKFAAFHADLRAKALQFIRKTAPVTTPK